MAELISEFRLSNLYESGPNKKSINRVNSGFSYKSSRLPDSFSHFHKIP